MTTILCIYSAEPNFPATDQHPDALRYQAGGRWIDAVGGEPTADEIAAVLAPPRRLVMKSQIIDRLNGAGFLAAASAALNADLFTRERWYASDKPGVYADDPAIIAFLSALGADPGTILAP